MNTYIYNKFLLHIPVICVIIIIKYIFSNISVFTIIVVVCSNTQQIKLELIKVTHICS